ncbi:MAG: sensor histidine kinase [Myxococcota bacterium]
MKRGTRWWWWFATLAPLFPLLLVAWAERAPALAADELVSLAGEWEWRAAAPGVDPLTADGWAAARLPGSFKRLSGERVWLRRTFEAPARLVGRPAALAIRQMFELELQVTVNGRPASLSGLRPLPVGGAEASAELHLLEPGSLRAGPNTVVFEARNVAGGIIDTKLYLGPAEPLAAWAAVQHQRRMLALDASLGVLGVLAALVVALRMLQSKAVSGATLLLLGAGALYVARKAGLLVPAGLSHRQEMLAIVLTVLPVGLSLVEFLERFLLGGPTRLGRFNRWLHLLVLLAALAVPDTAYVAYSVYLFALAFYGVGLGFDTLRRRPSPGVLTVTLGVLVIIGAAMSDLLGDLGIHRGPRLFGFAVANLAVLSATVVIAEFLQLTIENQRLSASLAQRADELAIALHQAEDAARAKSEFLANTSHELRTPLNAIINIPRGLLEHFRPAPRVRCTSCARLFELEAGEAPPSAQTPCPACGAPTLTLEASLAMELAPAEVARLLESVARSGTHLLSVVNDILDFSKLEAGRMVLHREPFDVRSVLDDVEATMRPVAEKAGVALVVPRPATELLLDGDRLKVQQVVLNLVANAIKFSDGRGTVTLEAGEHDGAVRLAVRDEGIGIAPEHHALIFEGFRQVDGGNTRRFGGSGLGLAISRQLVTMHGGTLTVQSAPGRGSTFVVDLPKR